MKNFSEVQFNEKEMFMFPDGDDNSSVNTEETDPSTDSSEEVIKPVPRTEDNPKKRN